MAPHPAPEPSAAPETTSRGGHRAATARSRALLIGALSVNVPIAFSLGTGSTGGTLTRQMGTVTVVDSRAPGSGSWTATVSTTDYTRTTSPAAMIGRANMFYWSGPATDTQGPGAFTPGQPRAAQAVRLDTPRTAFSHTSIAGINQASWTPTLILLIPFGAPAGTYSGVVIHSVA